MPNIMIHEEVGYFLSKRIGKNSYNYYLGILTPDAVNLNGFAPKIDRWTSHLRSKNYSEWRCNIKEFYYSNIDKINKDFLLGYFIHVLTDIIYDDFIYLDVREKIINDGISLEDSHNTMRNDMDNYYFDEINNIIEILKSSNDSYDINNISYEMLDKWKNKCINDFSNNNSSKYITDDVIDLLNKKVYEEVLLITKPEVE